MTLKFHDYQLHKKLWTTYQHILYSSTSSQNYKQVYTIAMQDYSKMWQTALIEIQTGVSQANFSTWFKETNIRRGGGYYLLRSSKFIHSGVAFQEIPQLDPSYIETNERTCPRSWVHYYQRWWFQEGRIFKKGFIYTYDVHASSRFLHKQRRQPQSSLYFWQLRHRTIQRACSRSLSSRHKEPWAHI